MKVRTKEKLTYIFACIGVGKLADQLSKEFVQYMDLFGAYTFSIFFIALTFLLGWVHHKYYYKRVQAEEEQEIAERQAYFDSWKAEKQQIRERALIEVNNDIRKIYERNGLIYHD